MNCDCNELNMMECITEDNTTECVPITWACSGLSFCVSYDEKLCQQELENNVQPTEDICSGKESTSSHL